MAVVECVVDPSTSAAVVGVGVGVEVVVVDWGTNDAC